MMLSLPSLEFVRCFEKDLFPIVQHLQFAVEAFFSGERPEPLVVLSGQIDGVVFDQEKFGVIRLIRRAGILGLLEPGVLPRPFVRTEHRMRNLDVDPTVAQARFGSEISVKGVPVLRPRKTANLPVFRRSLEEQLEEIRIPLIHAIRYPS